MTFGLYVQSRISDVIHQLVDEDMLGSVFIVIVDVFVQV